MSDRPFLLLGVGETATGAESLKAFMTAVSGSGIGWVLILQPPPAGDSALPSLLQDLPGAEASRTGTAARLEADQVYVVTASQVEIVDGHVVPESGPPRDSPAGSGDSSWRVQVGSGASAGEERVRRLLSRLITVQEDERRRIARDLHDHIGQQMTALRLHLNALVKSHGRPDWPQKAEALDAMLGQIDHDLAFLAWELRPAALDDLGLGPALQRFVHQWSKNYQIEGDFLSSGLDERQLTLDLKTALYRIAQESLNNVYKHARATRASVVLGRRGTDVILMIEDNGIGFSPSALSPGQLGEHMGLVGMHERASLVGGTCTIESEPGKGTTILVQAPARYESAEPLPSRGTAD